MRNVTNCRWPLHLFFLPALFSLSIAHDTLAPTQSLPDGQTLTSSGGSFALGFFGTANSTNRYVGIWYSNIEDHTVVWVANRRRPITSSNGSLAITGNGTLVITDQQSSNIVWSAGTATNTSNPVAQLLDTGNFVIRGDTEANLDAVAWQSFDYPTDTMLPGMKLGLDRRSGLNRNITAWASSDDPSPGPCSMFVDAHGDPQLLLTCGSSRVWRGGPWDGIRFSGTPALQISGVFNATFVDNQDEVYYTYNTPWGNISRVIVNSNGTMTRFLWFEESSSWSIFLSEPKDVCDRYSLCGPYGFCNPIESGECNCLQGFKPRAPANWALRDGYDGCVRKTELDCKNGTDGFVTLSGAKLPDTSNATVDLSLRLDECKAQCLADCSCTGYAAANISGRPTGCIIWRTELTDMRVYEDSGQDIYVRVASADADLVTAQSHKGRHLAIAMILSTVSGAVLALGCIVFCWLRRKKRRTVIASFHHKFISDEALERNELELPILDFGTIVDATDNFSELNMLGEGGFGPVYKGKIEGKEIAVKRLSKTSMQGPDEFKTEVRLIAKLQHRNLVRLLGCCIHGDERILIYEYMANKSLDTLLFDKEKGVSLDWQIRYNIIIGIARGLLYLHQDSIYRIIHRDLKASNILLDKEMNPKISDFGMARIFGGDETKSKTTRVVGTYGYMSPEYVVDGIFSVKSDVYSFGVLVLEIISGQKNKGAYLSEPHQYLLGHAWNLWKEGNALRLIDPSTAYFSSASEVLKCINIGLLCVQELAEDRPTMSSVVLMLSSDGAILPNPKQPGFVARKCPSSRKDDLYTINNLTLTVTTGR